MPSYSISSMENAPKDRRIVAYGVHAWEARPSWATVKWYAPTECWVCDPCEASEYPAEKSECSLWFDLPQDGVIADNGPKQDQPREDDV